jgi:CPA1 family monovalent cation:H+ antiporter
MPHIVLVVSIVAGLLFVIALLQAFASRLAIPHSVVLAAVGVFLGSLGYVFGDMHGYGAIGEIVGGVTSIELSSDAILYIFLPVLLFEAGLTMDVRRMMDEIGPILALAILAVVVCTVVVGGVLWYVSGVALAVCLLLGAIVATTDPVAVIGIFRDVGAPRRLSILVEGEALFNDAAAITLSVLFIGFLSAESGYDAGEGVLLFVRFFIGGTLFGVVCGRLGLAVMAPLARFPLAEITATIALPYLTFIVAEHFLHVSGIVAVVVTALVFGSSGRVRLSSETWEGLLTVWEQLGFLASTMIFIFAALMAPDFLVLATWYDVAMVGVLYLAAFAARFLVLWLVLPALARFGFGQPIGTRYRLVILWGGLRGSITLALALAISEGGVLDAETTQFVVVLATGFVGATLVVNATTLRLLMRALGLDRLPPVEEALRDRSIDLARAGIGEEIRMVAERHHLPSEAAEEVANDYRVDENDVRPFRLDPAVRERYGLMVLANHEEEVLLDQFNARLMSRRAVVELTTQAGRLYDGALAGGRAGYVAAVAQARRPALGLRVAVLLQRYVGWEAPLAERIALRFETLMVERMVIDALSLHVEQRLRRLLGAPIRRALDETLAARLETTVAALDALRLQYPEYGRVLSFQLLRRAALRLEDRHYRDLLDNHVVGGDVYEHLRRHLDAAFDSIGRPPPLDLGLSRIELVGRLPFFAGLDEAQLAQICRLLRPMVVFPGEVIVRAGERGDTMFFISSGAVEGRRDRLVFRLGTGDFFGEMALLSSNPRSATVTAIGYSRLLALNGRDFRGLAQAHPDLRETIEATARMRMNPPEPAETDEPQDVATKVAKG